MDKILNSRYPINGTFELTVRCNLDCKMCLFRHKDEENSCLRKKELTASEWIDMAKQVADAGTLTLLITGGEAMLREDFCEIWEGIYKLGFIIQLYTNATLVNERIMDTLRKYPPHLIGITIYGSNEEIYESVCGNGKAFRQMIEGAKQLATLPSTLEFRTTIIKNNFNDVRKMEELIQKEFNYPYLLKQTECVLPPVRGGYSKARELRLDPNQNFELMYRRGIDQIISIVGEDHFDIDRIKLTLDENKEEKNRREKYTFLGCNGGMTNYTISYDGTLRPCQILEPFYTDALNDGFKEAWQKLPFTINLSPINEKCMNCEISKHCNTCIAARYAETGDTGGLPAYQCAIAQEFAKHVK